MVPVWAVRRRCIPALRWSNCGKADDHYTGVFSSYTADMLGEFFLGACCRLRERCVKCQKFGFPDFGSALSMRAVPHIMERRT